MKGRIIKNISNDYTIDSEGIKYIISGLITSPSIKYVDFSLFKFHKKILLKRLYIQIIE